MHHCYSNMVLQVICLDCMRVQFVAVKARTAQEIGVYLRSNWEGHFWKSSIRLTVIDKNVVEDAVKASFST